MPGNLFVLIHLLANKSDDADRDFSCKILLECSTQSIFKNCLFNLKKRTNINKEKGKIAIVYDVSHNNFVSVSSAVHF